MQTNLDKMFKTNSEHETDGIWLMINENAGFLVKRFGGKNNTKIAKRLSELQKPYAKQIQMGTIDEKVLNDLNVRVFVETCVLDWKGIVINDEEIKFETEKCIELFNELPDLMDSVVQYASDMNNYKEYLGNS